MKIRVLFLICAACQLPAWTGPAAAGQKEYHLKVQTGAFTAIPVAVPPFESVRDAAWIPRMRDILIADLDFTGLIRVLPAPSGTLPREAAAFIETRCSARDGGVQIRARLKDALTKSVILESAVRVTETDFRVRAHEWADAVLLHLTGERGIASTRIAYIIKRGRAGTVTVSDIDGADVRRVSPDDSLNLSPSWSPDGRRLCYTSYASGRPRLAVFDLEAGRAARFAAAGGMQTSPAWSPDGKWIAFTLTTNGNSDLFCSDETGGALRRLTDSPAIDCSPAWSPDGREIAFTSDRGGSPQIYLMDASGGNVRRLTWEGGYNDSPAWSPKGDRIAYVTRDRTGFQVCVIDVNGENRIQLTDDPVSHEDPCWSPNGLHLAFSSNPGGRWDIFIMRQDGTGIFQVTRGGGNLSPAWSPFPSGPSAE